jgi:PKD domain
VVGRPSAVLTRAALLCALALAVPAAAHAAPAARVQGRFAMRARVTDAVGLPGEHRGQRLVRTWRITPRGCHRDTCARLQLRRTLSAGRQDRVTLHRRGDGTYVGRGQFFVALRCRGRIYRHGSRAPFVIRLRVTATRTIGGIRFARRLAATYDNSRRIESTPCSVTPSHDAARYRGSLAAGTPAPPRPSFAVQVVAGGALNFTDTSRPGAGRGGRLTHWHWTFGDPASRAADRARGRTVQHVFGVAGSYRVTLTVIDHAGLRSTIHRTVTIPAPQLSAYRTVASTSPRRVTRRAIGTRTGATTA